MTKDEIKVRQIAKKHPKWRKYLKNSKTTADRQLFYIKHYKEHIKSTIEWNKNHASKQTIYRGRSCCKRFIKSMATRPELSDIRRFWRKRKQMLESQQPEYIISTDN